MARLFDEITPELAAFIAAQPLFFVATAPAGTDGHVNCSPKGLDTFRVLGPHDVAYLDLTGSGAETIAHVRENGRITFMFCAFDGRPSILRLHGRARAIPWSSPEADALRARFEPLPGARSIVHAQIERVATSCGYAVPIMRKESDRTTLLDWATKKGPDGLNTYRREKNSESIDGLSAHTDA